MHEVILMHEENDFFQSHHHPVQTSSPFGHHPVQTSSDFGHHPVEFKFLQEFKKQAVF